MQLAEPLLGHARSGAHEEDLLAHGQGRRLDGHLGHRDLAVEVHHLAHVDLAARGRRPVGGAVLHHRAAGVVALPETAVEDCRQPLLEPGGQPGSVGARLDGPQRLVVAGHHALHVLGAARAALDLEHADARRDHAVEEVDGAEVLGRKHVAAVDVELGARLAVADRVFAAAQLAAGAPVGRAARLVERKIALARDRHAERPVGEHLDAHPLARGAADVVAVDLAADRRHLLER